MLSSSISILSYCHLVDRMTRSYLVTLVGRSTTQTPACRVVNSLIIHIINFIHIRPRLDERKRVRVSTTYGGQGESGVPPSYTRGSVSLPRGPGRKPGASFLYTRKRLSPTGARAKAWRLLLIHAEASLSHGGQGESLVPPSYTRGSVSLPRGAGRKPGASFLYTWKRLSLYAYPQQPVMTAPNIALKCHPRHPNS